MRTHIYDIGDQPSLRATFYDAAEQLADPSDITFRLRKPDGTELTPETEADATHVSTGVYEWLIPAPFDASGTWTFRAEASGDFFTAGEIAVKVRQSAF